MTDNTRLAKAVCLLFCFVPLSLGQSVSDVFKLKSRIEFSGKKGIVGQTPLENGKKLLLIGENEAKIWDVSGDELLGSYSHGFSFPSGGLLGRMFYGPTYGIIEASVDGFQLLRVEKLPGHKYESAIVWDLKTGKQAGILDRKLRPVREAGFSANGKIIVSTHGDLKDMEICFWNADKLALRTSIHINDLGWYQLSQDGERVFIATGKAQKWLNYLVIDYEDSSSIGLWDTASGKEKMRFIVGDAASPRPIKSNPKLSPDKKYLAAVSENRIVVWDTNGNGAIKYAITPTDPTNKFRLVGFSPDGRFLMAAEGKTGRVYNAETGALYKEIALDSNLNLSFSPTGRYILSETLGRQQVTDIEDTNHSYKINLQTHNDKAWDDKSTMPSIEYTVERLESSPNDKFLLLYGYTEISLLEASTGKVLQRLFDPQRAKFKDNGKVKDNGLRNYRAGWLNGGDSIYALSQDGKSCLIWNIN